MVRRWTQSITDDDAVRLVRHERADGVERPRATTYDVRFPATVGEMDDATVVTPGDAVVGPVERSRGEPTGALELTVTVPDDAGVERVVVSWSEGRAVVYVPSARIRERCEAAIDGDESAAAAVLAAFETPVQVPLICGAFLDLPEVVALVDAVTAADGHASSVIHSFRYPILRAALVCPTGLSVSSDAELEALVAGFDAIDAIGSVGLVDALSETMATAFGSATQTAALVASLGYDLADLERRDDGQFFACHLAHLVTTDGVRAARGHTMRRRWQLDGNYERRKFEARTAAYPDRGREWRALLCASARESTDEFVYVLANALYWTGYAVRSDSRMAELLYDGASTVVTAIDLPELRARAQFESHIAAGHRLRSCHQFVAAARRFRDAKWLATRHEFLPTWEPRYNEVVVHAHDLTADGDHEAASRAIDDGIGDLLAYDIHPEAANRAIHHLKGQQLEAEAESVGISDPSRIRGLLRDARDHYAVIDFDRSRDRVERKLEHVEWRHGRRATPVEDDTVDAPGSVADPEVDGADATSHETTDVEPRTTETGPSRPATEPDDASTPGPTGAEPRPAPESVAYPDFDDPLTPHDESLVGSADVVTGPESRRNDADVPGERDETAGGRE
ncbi:hypothetical protein [Salinigranum salinum]|uniref:hypothetical protein n=1 Tax=Salinigranum salinum TaxID=1364937 RepID=UPI001260CEFB|nr:hypothetical protein [Salinigranum salinum]